MFSCFRLGVLLVNQKSTMAMLPLCLSLSITYILKCMFLNFRFYHAKSCKSPFGTWPYKNYTEQTSKEVIDFVRDRNFSIKKDADLKLIPRKTLENKIKNRYSHDVGMPHQGPSQDHILARNASRGGLTNEEPKKISSHD